MACSGGDSPLEAWLAREVIELRKDRERLDWVCSEENQVLPDWVWDEAAKLRPFDWIWDEAAKLCPLDWDEAEDTQKWGRAAIDSIMKR